MSVPVPPSPGDHGDPVEAERGVVCLFTDVVLSVTNHKMQTAKPSVDTHRTHTQHKEVQRNSVPN